MSKKILIVEDERDISRILKYNLEKEGYLTISAYDGENGLKQFIKEKPDLVLLDIMLPKLNGMEFMRIVRKESETPIMMLTAKKEEIDKVLGFEMGADDYVTKPFSVREVMVRVKALLKRMAKKKESPSVITCGALEVDIDRYEVLVKGKPVALGSKEFEFIKYLAQADGKVLSRDQLLERVWGYDHSQNLDTRTVDQHVSRIRNKLGSGGAHILTVKNVGYRLK